MAPSSERETALVEIARAVRAARGALAGSASWSLASEQLVSELLGGIAELARVVDALQVRLAGEVAQRSGGPADESFCKKLGARSPKDALATAFGSRSREAADLLALAAATTATTGISGGEVPARYPRVGGALGAAAVSTAQALAIVRALEPAEPRAEVEQLAWAEGVLVDSATDPDEPLGPELLTTQGKVFEAVLDPDGVLPDAERLYDERSATISRRRNGSWRTVITSPPEDGAVLKSAVDAINGPRTKVRFQDTDGLESTDDGPIRHADDCTGTGSDGQSCDGCGTQWDLDVDEASDERTLVQKQHDAILGMVRAAVTAPGAPTAGGAPATLVFSGTFAAYQAYLRGDRHREGFLRIEHTGDIVPMEWVERLICGGDVQLCLADANRHPLALGRAQRLFTPAQRRALAHRDKGCAVKGCGMPPSWCEAHHVTPWKAGGPTDVDNGILLCSHHHHEVHAGRLRIEAKGTGPGQWRIVSQLRRPRAGRGTWIDDLLAATIGDVRTIACDAPRSRAVRIPDEAAVLELSALELSAPESPPLALPADGLSGFDAPDLGSSTFEPSGFDAPDLGSSAFEPSGFAQSGYALLGFEPSSIEAFVVESFGSDRPGREWSGYGLPDLLPPRPESPRLELPRRGRAHRWRRRSRASRAARGAAPP